MTPEIETLYENAMAAEREFQFELASLFGNDACHARYDRRSESTPILHDLARRKIDTYRAYRVAAFPHANH